MGGQIDGAVCGWMAGGVLRVAAPFALAKRIERHADECQEIQSQTMLTLLCVLLAE